MDLEIKICWLTWFLDSSIDLNILLVNFEDYICGIYVFGWHFLISDLSIFSWNLRAFEPILVPFVFVVIYWLIILLFFNHRKNFLFWLLVNMISFTLEITLQSYESESFDLEWVQSYHLFSRKNFPYEVWYLIDYFQRSLKFLINFVWGWLYIDDDYPILYFYFIKIVYPYPYLSVSSKIFYISIDSQLPPIQLNLF